MMKPDRGLVAAAVTPRGKRGELNFGAAFELIDHLSRGGVGAIALLTATGDYPSFTVEERTRLIYLGVKRSRVPVLAGVGAEDLSTAVELAREALAAGAEGVILPPPLLHPYTAEDLREYYLQFASQAGRDAEIWIDGAPGAAELVGAGNFAGASGDGLKLSVDANAIPELLVQRECARHKGNGTALAQLEALVMEFEQRAAAFPPTLAVRVATAVRGIAVGALPLPLNSERARELEEFRGWFANWLPTAKKAARA